MARSVDYLAKSLYTTFFPYPTCTGEDEEWEQYLEWEYFKEDLVFCIKSGTLEEPKYEYCDGETVILLVNKHCEIGVSAYFGLVSLSIRVNENYLDNCVEPEDWDKEYAESKKWIHENWPEIKATIPYEILYKVATFSNGESVYSKTGAL